MSADFQPDSDGRYRIDVTNTTDGSAVTVYQQGAHVTSWHSKDGEEHLYNSPKSVYKDGKAIRGGVPLIFPQFSDLGPLPTSHGFLRTDRRWSVKSAEQKGDTYELVLSYDLQPGQERDFEEADCSLLYTITFTASELKLEMSVQNHSDSDLVFAFAFHTYFSVDDIEKAEVSGFDDTTYLDDLQDRKKCEPAPVSRFTEEIDRIYLNQNEKPIIVRTTAAKEPGKAKTLTIVGTNFKDAVLWNPWIEKTKKMSDMPEDGYKKFVCVEHGTIIEKEHLAPQKTWKAAQTITVSYPEAPHL